MKKKRNLIIVTHRGGKGPFPENTPEAYRRAVAQGAEAVEMDIRLNYITGRFFWPMTLFTIRNGNGTFWRKRLQKSLMTCDW